MSALPNASVAIVNWNGRAHLKQCLPSVFALDYPTDALECVVVDNGSTDGSREWLASTWPQVRVVANPENRGFAAGANGAATVATGEVVAFLNNDCRVAPTWLRSLVDALASEQVVAAGSRILDWDGRRIDFDGAAMNFHGHGSNRGFGRPVADAQRREPEPSLFACGGAMAVDRTAFLAAGGFDDEYFAYFEDVDFGWRLWVRGERVVHVPAAVAYHRHRGSGMDAARWRYLLERNALATVFKNYDDASLPLVLPAARTLLDARAELATGAAGDAHRDALRAFDAELPAWREARARVQAGRRRSDAEIVPLFREPFRPSAFGRAYWETQCRLVRTHDLARVFGAATVDAVEGLGPFVGELQDRIVELTTRLAERGEH